MKASQFFKMYFSLQKSNTDRNYWQTLADRLELDTNRRIRELSRGNRQKVGVVAAFMNKPELLILDEPTSGLDPLMQQTVMEIVQEANQHGSTVFFSSHILSEVHTVCDRVGIIREGQLVATERVEDMTRQQFKRLRIGFDQLPPEDAFAIEGVTELVRDDQAVELEIRENIGQVMKKAVSFGINDIETIPVTLEEIFLAYYGKGNGGKHV
jgi:ABC-2 type transport system ATP-binding protein